MDNLDYYKIASRCLREEGDQWDCRSCDYYQFYHRNDNCKNKIILSLLNIIDSKNATCGSLNSFYYEKESLNE